MVKVKKGIDWSKKDMYEGIGRPNLKPKIKKDCLFQYALGKGFGDLIKENTDLITRKEAEKLWDKYYPDFIEKLQDGYEPQMGIWINCKTVTDYHTLDPKKELDYRDDLSVENGVVYRKTKEKII